MEPLSDPVRLRTRSDVDVHEETRTVPQAEFEAMRGTVDSHVAVGLPNDDGAVLLQDDGSHGWSLPAFTVESGEEWTAIGRQGVTRLAGVPVELDRPERLRRIDIQPDGTADGGIRMYNVVYRAVPVEGRPVTDDVPADVRDVDWFDRVPAEQDGELAADIRLFVA
ncbi:NUDIX hydrolase [Halosolutus amylolyticus]|uniref:NUDIX hydrolase n=1 Tax=Halosolutus amylolyticus TaxID=2932267 RepID=A0ABD5PSW8_9EURY|nr:hypothetical protein [Halosolutus amylolyticus]